MIVPMKKVAIVMQAKDAEPSLKILRSVGVVHIEHQQPPAGKDIVSLKEELVVLDKVIGVLSSPEYSPKGCPKDARIIKDWHFTAKHILDVHARIDHLEEYTRLLSASIAVWKIWGDFNPADIEKLRERGIAVRLYQIPVKELKSIPADIVVRKILEEKGMAYCAVVSRAKVDIRFQELVLPKMSLEEMKARLAESVDTKRALQYSLRKFACYIERFINIKKAFLRELEFHEALRGKGEAGALAYVVGYVPVEKAPALEATAKKERWGLLVTEPLPDDPVPTLVRNPRWVSTISPVFKLIEIVPGYHELDISPLFLLALSLFFGMIIGDAGYGALYIALTFFVQMKFGKKIKDHTIFSLLYLFSAAAILWGVITGTVFGQEWYVKAGMKPLIPLLNDTKFLQAFCFFIGAVHLSLAHGWQAIRKLPSLTALADLGWISVIWAAFFLACMLILGDPLPAFTKWLIIGGVLSVIIGTSPQRNILKMIGSGLGNVALSIINNFTDVVSYVRLFAVGLAGVAIADTVNTLASEVGNPVAQVLVLFVGHTINILLGPLSVLVHGVRLNVLEFSGHAGLTWSGVRYKPLEE